MTPLVKTTTYPHITYNYKLDRSVITNNVRMMQDVMSDSSVEEFMLGMASQLAEREDAVLCSDVRDKLFGPNEFSRRDLGALNIMRGRDNGLADYNTVVLAKEREREKTTPTKCCDLKIGNIDYGGVS